MEKQFENTIKQGKQAEIIAIAGSAGSFSLLIELIKVFVPEVSPAIVMLIHRSSGYKSEWLKILSKYAVCEVLEIVDKQKIEAGKIYIPPQKYHTMAEPTFCWSLDSGEPVWFSRPSIDVLFESIADIFGEKALGILLSGANQDGAIGIKKIAEKGGLTIIQNPEDAEYKIMTKTALTLCDKHYVLHQDDILTFCRNLIN